MPEGTDRHAGAAAFRSSLPEIRADVGLATVAAFLNSEGATRSPRLEAIHDLLSGVPEDAVAERHGVTRTALRNWIRSLNARGAPWLAEGQSDEFLRNRCRLLTSLGLSVADTAKCVGVDEAFVKGGPGNSAAEQQKRRDERAIRDLHLVLQGHSEPLRTYADVVYRLATGTRQQTVMKDFELSDKELKTIRDVYGRKGVEGLAADPLGAAAKTTLWTDQHGANILIGDEGRRVAPEVRIRSYKRLASRADATALESVAMAAEGRPLSEIADRLSLDPEAVRLNVSRFASRWSTDFMAGSSDVARVKGLTGKTGRIDELLSLSLAIPDKVLARNLAIVCAVAQGARRSYVCDHRHVTLQFVEACVSAFERYGFAGLAAMTPGHEENQRVSQEDNEPASISLFDDLRRRVREPPDAGRSHAVTATQVVAAIPATAPKAEFQRDAGRRDGMQQWQPGLHPVYHRDAAVHLPRHGEEGDHVAYVALPDKFETLGPARRDASIVRGALERAAFYGAPGLVVIGFDPRDARSSVSEVLLGGEAASVEHCIALANALVEHDDLHRPTGRSLTWRLVPFFMTRLASSVETADVRSLGGYARRIDGRVMPLWAAADIYMHPVGGEWLLGETALLPTRGRNGPVTMFENLGRNR